MRLLRGIMIVEEKRLLWQCRHVTEGVNAGSGELQVHSHGRGSTTAEPG